MNTTNFATLTKNPNPKGKAEKDTQKQKRGEGDVSQRKRPPIGQWAGGAIVSFRIPWFDPAAHLDGSERLGIIGLPGTGKSCCVKSLLHALHGQFGKVMAMSGSESDNRYYESFIPKLFVHNRFSVTALKQFVNGQRLLRATDPNGAHQHSLIIMDDVLDNARQLDQPVVHMLYKQGRHINSSVWLVQQYPMDVRPFIRSTTSAVILYGNVNQQARRKMYDNYGSLFPSFAEFEAAFEHVTTSQPHTALVILLKGSRPIQSAVFWYRADLSHIPPGFIVGHPRMQEHSAARLDAGKAQDMGLLSMVGSDH